MGQFPLVSMVRVNQARQRFFDQGAVPAGLIPDAILRSWQRSLACGVQAEGEPEDLPILSATELSSARQACSDLLDLSRPVMECLYEQVSRTSSLVILTDINGTILHSLGDAGFVGKARKVSLQPGGVWGEEQRGTNAIGTCLVERAPIQVHRTEHFTAANQFLTCSASPIFDPVGRISGVLDLSGDGRAYQQHSMALVRIATQQIENLMFSKTFHDDFVLHFHRHPQFVGTFHEGIAVFSPVGQLIAANRSALLQLAIDRYQMLTLGFDDLFDLSFKRFVQQTETDPARVLELRNTHNQPLFVRVRSVVKKNRRTDLVLAASAPRVGQKTLQLEDLNLGDPQLHRVIERARKVLNHDIPIMLVGESGTGKELFAQALHHSGPRRNAPFVALNCAAIPAELIEAELFGYCDGAFTGARRKGYAGKIRQADGGTLFLDEIGDMPLELQARLLRVLQERKVAPLGSLEEHPVDMAVLCATNRKIREEVEAGRFREDLYYRLNGLLLTLPPLRERQDRLALAEALLAELTPTARRLELSPQVRALFDRHTWPGNIRQLHSLLRTAVALMDEQDARLELEHLSEDFIEQCMHPGDAVLLQRPLSELLEGDAGLGELEQLAIRQALDECRGNLSAAARKLGISRTTLYRKLEKEAV